MMPNIAMIRTGLGALLWGVSLTSCTPHARISDRVGVEGWLPKPASKTPTETKIPAEPAAASAARVGEQKTTIGLEAVLELAEANGLVVAIARQQAEGALAEEELAFSRLLPTAGPRYQMFRHSGEIQSTEGNFLDVYKQNTFYGAGVEMEFNPVGDWFGLRAARQRTESRVHGIEAATHLTIREAARRFFSLVEAHAEIRIARQAREHARELVTLTDARQRRGVGLNSDTLRAQARLAETESEASRAEGAAGIASARLVEILRLDDGTTLVPGDTALRVVNFIDDSRPLGTLLDRAYATRPDLAALEAEAQARENDLNAAKAWVFPTVHAESLVGGFGRHEDNLKDRQNYFLELEWKWGGGVKGKIHRAAAAQRESELKREFLKRHIAAEVGGALVGVRASRSALEAVEREVAAAEEGLQLARSRYDAGEGLFLEVLDVEALSARAQSNRARAILSYNRAQFDLLHAVGGPEASLGGSDPDAGAN